MERTQHSLRIRSLASGQSHRPPEPESKPGLACEKELGILRLRGIAHWACPSPAALLAARPGTGCPLASSLLQQEMAWQQSKELNKS